MSYSDLAEPSRDSLEPEPWKKNYGIFHPERNLFRFTILILDCLTILGSYYSYDSIAAISTELIEDMDISLAEFGLLYSVYSIPNMVMVFFGGILLDKLGLRPGMLLYLGLIALGTGLVAIAPYMKSYYIMLLGRFIFGVGSESSYIAQDVVCVVWFSGRLLSFSMALIGSFGRLGELLAFNTMVEVSHAAGDYRVSLWFAWLVAMFSFVVGIVLCILDKWGEKQVIGKDRKTGDIVRWSDIKKLPKAYWSLVVMGVSFFCVIFPFISYASDFLQVDRGYEEAEAGTVVSILSFVSLFLGPIVGLMLDKVGYRAVIMFFGMMLTLPALYLMAFDFGAATPYVVMILLGVAYSFIPGVLWPALSLVVPEDKFATAYGLLMAVGNTFLVFVYAAVGVLAEDYSSAAALMLLVAFALLGFAASMLWNYFDYYEMDSIANKPTAEEHEDSERQPLTG